MILKRTMLFLLVIFAGIASDKQLMYDEHIFEVSISSEQIASRVQELGNQISHDYKDSCPVLIGVLNGGAPFLIDLSRALSIDCELDFIQLASYGDDLQSSGTVQFKKGLSRSIEGRDVIIVEDIIESGRSMQYAYQALQALNPRSIRIASLLHKDLCQLPFAVDYIGFHIAPEFVVGCGLDYAQRGRNLKHVYKKIN